MIYLWKFTNQKPKFLSASQTSQWMALYGSCDRCWILRCPFAAVQIRGIVSRETLWIHRQQFLQKYQLNTCEVSCWAVPEWQLSHHSVLKAWVPKLEMSSNHWDSIWTIVSYQLLVCLAESHRWPKWFWSELDILSLWSQKMSSSVEKKRSDKYVLAQLSESLKCKSKLVIRLNGTWYTCSRMLI